MTKKTTASRLMNQLAKYRKQKGLSQTQLAKLIGVAQSTIAMIETGKITPSLRTALKLARVLGTTVEELFPLEDDAEDK